jgi:hypothetical protein
MKNIVILPIAAFFAVSFLSILDPAPRPTGDVVKSRAQLIENAIVHNMIVQQQKKLAKIKQ